MDNPFSLVGKNIVITGATSGIGLACSELLCSLGANLVLIGRSNDKLMLLKERLSNRHTYLCLDITEYDKVEFEFHKLKIIVDGIIHSAGISTTLPLKNVTSEKIQPFIETNVYAGLHLTKVLTSMRFRNKDGMSVIFIASVMGVVGELGKTIYSLTKGALISSSRSLALELASKKIRVNCISPGVVETPMSGNAVYAQSKEAYSRVNALHPLGLGQPSDIANACVFLLSDGARWITGSNLIVDGGYTAK
ncbi:SDR family NAD(P)-dependent oxidoreductase [Myroides odoratimimus]|uniref:SDR family NAD(P)-dependent oxidoreductase n=1 Tax=Myroides odoratimimus TaxID=76832 RepID=UPI0025755C12|nr:SDR family oxidoreductase [Myroides odoratimimus]MDM1039138.1 SDR family oxidoreductase [Myroides odoratimimus]MDM1053325.1 SDR family oxidoreductase [Myroides odoratimimus]